MSFFVLFTCNAPYYYYRHHHRRHEKERQVTMLQLGRFIRCICIFITISARYMFVPLLLLLLLQVM